MNRPKKKPAGELDDGQGERPRLSRRAQLVRADIVQSAAKSFACKGFVGTTMEDVARDAGFAPSSLYGYFSGKEELFVATLDKIAEQLLEVFDDRLLQELPFVERIFWSLRRVCQLIEPNREFFILIFGQAPFIEWSASSSTEVSDVGKRAYRRLIQRLADEIATGDPRKPTTADALDLAYVLSGAFQTWVFRWLHGDMPDGLQESLSRLFARLHVLLDVEAP